MHHIVVQGQKRHIYGWKPDRPDHRDRILAADVAGVPAESEHLPFHPPIVDQGQLGSCTANGSTSALEYLELKEGKTLDVDLEMFSRLFTYYNSRFIEGTVTQDAGAEIRDVMKALSFYGACPERYWPYDTSQFAAQPPHAAFWKAAQNKLSHYFRCPDLASIKKSIGFDRYPVVIGFSVPENMESAECAQTGIVKFPTPNEQIIGGHCVLATGYSDSKRLVRCQNSWGVNWGDKGYLYLPYEFFERGLVSDCWTLRNETF